MRARGALPTSESRAHWVRSVHSQCLLTAAIGRTYAAQTRELALFPWRVIAQVRRRLALSECIALDEPLSHFDTTTKLIWRSFGDSWPDITSARKVGLCTNCRVRAPAGSTFAFDLDGRAPTRHCPLGPSKPSHHAESQSDRCFVEEVSGPWL